MVDEQICAAKQWRENKGKCTHTTRHRAVTTNPVLELQFHMRYEPQVAPHEVPANYSQTCGSLPHLHLLRCALHLSGIDQRANLAHHLGSRRHVSYHLRTGNGRFHL